MILIRALLLSFLVVFSAHAGIEDWSSTDTSNNAAAPNGWPTGMSPADVKLTGRRMMSYVHDWYKDAQWIEEGGSIIYLSGSSFQVSTTTPSDYHLYRRIRAQSTGGYTYGTIVSATYSGTNSATVIIAPDSGTISSSLSRIWYGSIGATSPSVVSATLGLDSLATPDNITSGTTKIQLNQNNGISVTIGGVAMASFTTSGLTTSGTLTSQGITTGATSISSTLTLSSESATLTMTGTSATAFLRNISATTISATTVSATNVSATNITHPGVAKAWVKFSGYGTPTIFNQFNVSSISHVATGRFGISFTTPLNNANYVPNCFVRSVSGALLTGALSFNDPSPTTAGFLISVHAASSGALLDSGDINCIVMGN